MLWRDGDIMVIRMVSLKKAEPGENMPFLDLEIGLELAVIS